MFQNHNYFRNFLIDNYFINRQLKISFLLAKYFYLFYHFIADYNLRYIFK